MTTKFIFFVSIALFLFACSKPNVYIDNAGKEAKKVSVDGGNIFVIEPGGAVLMSLGKGAHKIWIKDNQEKMLKDTFFSLQKGGIVNISKSRYVRWRDLYGDEKFKDGKLENKKMRYQKWVFTGDILEYDSNALFVEKDWSYELDETFPQEATGYSFPCIKLFGYSFPCKEKYIISSKIYRIDDFAKEFSGKRDNDTL